jgi:hypothetical protein
MAQKIDRTGETGTNCQGLTMRIIEYTNCKNILVEFQDTDEVVHTSYYKFKKGLVCSPIRHKEELAQTGYKDDEEEDETFEVCAAQKALAVIVLVFIALITIIILVCGHA